MQHLRPGLKVIELGAGSGAFSKRLLDAGCEVVAVDFDGSDWQAGQVPLILQDLNASKWVLPHKEYELAVAIEVIEHLENPLLFLRNVRLLLKPGGMLFLTTPNVISVESRRRMLVQGEPSFFGRGMLFKSGHLAILPYWLLEDIFLKEGYQVVLRAFIGRQRLVYRCGRQWWKYAVVPMIDLLLLMIGRGIPAEAGFATNVAYLIAPGEAST